MGIFFKSIVCCIYEAQSEFFIHFNIEHTAHEMSTI